jgi:hypothetical protein
MTRLIGLALVALIAFYVAWPAWSGYSIRTALEADDKSTLAGKIDFERVRASLKPALTAEVEKAASAAVASAGRSPDVMTKLRADAIPKVVDSALTAAVSPEGVVRLYRARGDVKAELAAIVAEKLASPAGLALLAEVAGQVGVGQAGAGQGAAGGGGLGNVLGQLGKLAEKSGIDPGKMLGGLLGKPAGGGSAGGIGGGSGGSSSGGLSIDNLKSFGMTGPLGFEIGFAKNAKATGPEAVAEIAFTGGDWKLVGLRPTAVK